MLIGGSDCAAASNSVVRKYDEPTSMTYVVTENGIHCRYQDCMEVCPVDCFCEGENVLVIHPDEWLNRPDKLALPSDMAGAGDG